MLLWLAQLLQNYLHFLRVFQYLTFRSLMATLTALMIALLLGPKTIRYLNRLQIGQFVRSDGPQSHLTKQGTPTMGGVLILLSITLTTLLWSDLTNQYIWLVLLTTLAFGLIGWLDDYLKLVLRNSKGLPARWKFLAQILFGTLAAVYLVLAGDATAYTQLVVPFFKDVMIILNWYWFIPLAIFVMVGSSNAVNLTDGLDGLAIVPTVMVAGALGIFAYVVGHVSYAHYLALPHISGVGEVTIFAAAVMGSGLGFLWFNAYPAQVFMGDVGALGLGAALGLLAIIVRQELVLVIMGGIFVAETLSVILQVASFKLTGKRIFRMAPLHHHFELLGWPEPKVIVRFWLISMVLVLCGLTTLKLR